MRSPLFAPRSVLATALLACSVVAAPVQGQSATALGRVGLTTAGMAVGGGIGALAGTECDGFICIPPGVVVGVIGGGVEGLFAGGSLSGSVHQSREAGRPLSPGQMAALTAGSTLGGAALGALASALLIRDDGTGTPLGSDEQTFGILTALGAGFGVYKAIRFHGSILPEGASVRPDVMPDGRPGVRVSVRF